MSLRFRQRILAHLHDERYQPVDFNTLLADVGVLDEDEPEFQSALDRLVHDGLIVRDAKGHYDFPPIGDHVTGTIKVNPRGFAFILPEVPNREGDLFVPPGETLDAVTGDRVLAKVVRQHRRTGPPGSSPYVGRVVEILERGRTTFVGTLTRREGFWLVEIDNRRLNEPIVVRDVGAKNAREGDKVVVEVLKFPSPGDWGEGVITQRLGEAGQPDVETQSVIIGYDLPGPYPDEAVEQARHIASTFDERMLAEEIQKREDLREEFILTIDPPDARDFDDAISIARTEDGYELGVHIADVSQFVTLGSPLDFEARKRGNSVYLPRHVIPMLPEVLSNGICSLQEGVDRLTKSAFIRYDHKGKVLGTRFASTVIRSSKRLTYLEAEALIKGDVDEAKKHAMSESGYPEPLIPALQLMSELAGVIRKRRMKDGMIVLTLPEVNLIFDDNGRVIGAEPEDDASTHGLIEMFMVEANEAIASLFDRMQVAILRRTHPDPSTFDVGELRQFCRVAGVNVPKNPTRHELQKILEMTRGTPRQQAVHLAVLKSLTKAEYSPALIGHFALASQHYAHFTSPIRRYPDLLLHRSLQAFLERTNNGVKMPKGQGLKKLGRTLRNDPRCPDEDELVRIGRHCTQTEVNAEMAERSLRTFLVLQFLAEHHQGDTMEGVVVGVTSNAVYVQLDKFLVEGIVPVRALSEALAGDRRGDREERWKLNPDTGALVAARSGRTINLGDRMKVELTLIDPPARRLELKPILPPAEADGKGRQKDGRGTDRAASNGRVGGKKKSSRAPGGRGKRRR